METLTKTKNTPILRFSEFSEEWGKKKLEDVAFRGSGHTPNKKINSYYDGNIKWISLADSRYLDNGYIKTSKITISQEGIDNSSAVLHPKGSVLLSRDAGVGKSAVMFENMAVSQHFIVWNGKDNMLNNWFLYYKLQILKREFERIAVGSTIKTIGLPYFKKLKINLPSLPEQTKIANFLTAVDDKIGQLSKKKDLLEQYKKGMMQKIFSQEIRFKDDDGNDFKDWEEKKLGEVCSFFRGSSLGKKDLNETGKYFCIHYGELFTKYKEVIIDILSKTNLESGFFSEVGDIAMPSSDVTPYGLAKACSIQVKGVYLGGDMNILRPNNQCNSIFLSYLLNFSKKKIIQIVSGTTVKHVYNKDIKLISISLPSISEQTKIANFLLVIDKKNELANVELEKVKEFKKGLLQQMFV